jgi:hypothetical protein
LAAAVLAREAVEASLFGSSLSLERKQKAKLCIRQKKENE